MPMAGIFAHRENPVDLGIQTFSTACTNSTAGKLSSVNLFNTYLEKWIRFMIRPLTLSGNIEGKFNNFQTFSNLFSRFSWFKKWTFWGINFERNYFLGKLFFEENIFSEFSVAKFIEQPYLLNHSTVPYIILYYISLIWLLYGKNRMK